MSVHDEREFHVVMEGNGLQVVVLPYLGAKILSIRAEDGGELLWQDASRPLRPRQYGDRYDTHNASGWDECCPTIAPCLHPSPPWQGIGVPDHGELWLVPWHWEWAGDALHTWTFGVRFAYRFDRWLCINEAGSLIARYRVENLAPYPQDMIWSAHTLFAVDPDVEVLLPEHTQVLVDYTVGERLPIGLQYCAWPRLQACDAQIIDLSRFPDPSAATAEKLFTKRLTQGWVALFQPRSARYVMFSWNASEIPYVGLWLNAGGWPSGDTPAYHIGLEPCMGYPDRLERAVTSGDCLHLESGEARCWRLALHTGSAVSRDTVPQGGL